MTITGNPGTGSLTLLAAKPSYQTVLQAGGVNGTSYSYTIEEGDTKAECGNGTYNAGSFTRDTVYDSTAGYGLKETFTSAATFTITVLSKDLADIEKRAANKATGLALVMGG